MAVLAVWRCGGAAAVMAGQWCCYMMAGDIDMVAESVLESVIRVEVGMPRGEGGGGGQGGPAVAVAVRAAVVLGRAHLGRPSARHPVR